MPTLRWWPATALAKVALILAVIACTWVLPGVFGRMVNPILAQQQDSTATSIDTAAAPVVPRRSSWHGITPSGTGA